MANDTQKYKISNIYLSKETHATIKALAAHQESTIQATTAIWLEETQPILQDMVNALEDIKKGKDAMQTYSNFLAKSLHKAADSLETDEK